jgi:hypothetical protein
MNKQTIQFSTSQPTLINSLLDLNILHSPTVSNNYTRLNFFANDFCDFPQHLERTYQKNGINKLSYNDALQLALCLHKQINHLEQRKVTYLALDPSKIFVVDERHFIYLDEQVFPLHKNQTIQIARPFSKKRDLAPELLAIDKLPCYTSYKCIYYSLGALVSSCLIPLEQLKGTKLHSFLQRCLENDPEERTLLYL